MTKPAANKYLAALAASGLPGNVVRVGIALYLGHRTIPAIREATDLVDDSTITKAVRRLRSEGFISYINSVGRGKSSYTTIRLYGETKLIFLETKLETEPQPNEASQ